MTMSLSDDSVLADNGDDDDEVEASGGRQPPPRSQYHNTNLNNVMRPRGGDIGRQQPRHLFPGVDPWQGMQPHPLVPQGVGNYPPAHGYGPLPSQLVAA